MGSKLTILAGLLIATPAAADPFKEGIELYKAKKYDQAVPKLQKAYELDHKPETLFALAQAERLAGDCVSAAKHYHQVLDEVSDMNVAKLVQQSLVICEPEAAKPEPKPEPKSEPKAEPPPPQVITKTVVKETGHTDGLAVVSLAAGTLALGAAGGLYLAAGANKDASDQARTIGESNTLFDKSKSEMTASIAAGVAGAALIGFSIYRFTRSDEKPASSDVTIAPTNNGFTVVGRF